MNEACMTRDLILAHDVGTSGDKAALFDPSGTLLASFTAPYATHRPRPGWAEQDPDEWWSAVCLTTRRLLDCVPDAEQRIAGVGFSAMMNGAVLVDRNGATLRPALIHADLRGAEVRRSLAERIAPERAYDLSGHRLEPYFTLAKLAWLARNEPETLRRARWCLQAKDFLAGRLCGRYGVTDPSDASLTGMYDLRAEAWSDELVAASGIERSQLPEVVPSATVLGHVTREAAEATGLLQGTPVVLGGGDGACATAGAGAFAPGDAYHYLGSSSWLAVVSDGYRPDARQRITTMRGLPMGLHVAYGTVQSAGTCAEWFLDAIGPSSVERDPWAALEALVEQAPPGSDGLIFLPYLQGERAPIWDANARGAFVGLTLEHTRAHLARAVHEGVAFALGSILSIFDELGLTPTRVRALGGGMRSSAWRRILAAVYARPLVTLDRLTEATACGAAMATAVGVGLAADWQAASKMAPGGRVEEPDAATVAAYVEPAGRFRRTYAALARADMPMENDTDT